MNGKKTSETNRYTIHSIDKALDVMELLGEQESLSLLEMTEQLQQPKSSMYRILLTLENRGYIARSEETGKYCLGYKQLMIARNLVESHSLRSSAYSEMRKLSKLYGDTVNLGVLEGTHILYLEIIEGTHSLRMNETVGSTAPFYATAIGKAIVSQLDMETKHSLITEQSLRPITPNTITDPNKLLQELEKIAVQGYALDDEEAVQGARCIAAPIYSYPRKIEGAVSLSGALHRYPDDQLTTIAQDVVKAATRISQKMGYP